MSTLYPGSYQIPAMKYGKAPEHDKLLQELASKKYIAQPKVDGAYYQIEKTADGKLYLFGRSKSKKTGELSEKIGHVPHIAEQFENLPNGTVICGEIFYPGGTSKNVTSIMGALEDKAIERQKGEYGLIHYYMFDMIKYAGKNMLDMPFEKRYSNLCEYVDIDMPHDNYIEVASSFTGYGMWDNIQHIILDGGEGAVIKSKDGIYQPGKRPRANFKVKQAVDNVDFVIMDILDPEYYYTGKEADTWQYKNEDGELITKASFYHWAGAIRVGAYDDNHNLVAIGRVASGLTDEMKADMAKRPQDYIGQVVEIECMSLDSKELSFRHPFFKRMRPDKPAEDCLISEIFSK